MRAWAHLMILTAALVSILSDVAWASLEAEVSEVPAASRIEVSDAVVFDAKTSQPICQIAVSNQNDLVPSRMARASNESFDGPLVDGLPFCQGQEFAVIKLVAANALPNLKSATLVPVAGVLAWICSVGIIAGVDSVMAFEGYYAGPRGLKKSVYKEHAAVGALGGAAAAGSVVGMYELGVGFEVSSMLSTLGSGGVGLVCGMAGGITAFFVEYYKRHRASQSNR